MALVIVVVLAGLILAAPIVYIAARHHHAGGDSGGAILQSIREPMESLIPEGAHVTTDTFTEPKWTGSCGWTVVFGTLEFSTTMTGSQFLDRADHYLSAHGWRRMAGPGPGPNTWTQEVAGGAVKRIDLVPHSASTGGVFRLTGAAPPLGKYGLC